MPGRQSQVAVAQSEALRNAREVTTLGAALRAAPRVGLRHPLKARITGAAHGGAHDPRTGLRGALCATQQNFLRGQNLY